MYSALLSPHPGLGPLTEQCIRCRVSQLSRRVPLRAAPNALFIHHLQPTAPPFLRFCSAAFLKTFFLGNNSLHIFASVRLFVPEISVLIRADSFGERVPGATTRVVVAFVFAQAQPECHRHLCHNHFRLSASARNECALCIRIPLLRCECVYMSCVRCTFDGRRLPAA